MLKQPETEATESLRMTIMNDMDLLERFERTVFLDEWLTQHVLTRFQHFVDKYVEIDSWAKGTNPDYMALALEIIRFIHGKAAVALGVANSTLATSETQPEVHEETLMKPHTVEQRTFIDGDCLNHMSDDMIVSYIASIEEKREALEKIKTPSKAITKQLESLDTTTAELAAFLDGRLED